MLYFVLPDLLFTIPRQNFSLFQFYSAKIKYPSKYFQSIRTRKENMS